MIDCEQVRELIPWYVNGTLPCREAAAVAAHIASCPSCREELAEMLQLSLQVRNAMDDTPSVPERVWDRVRTEKGELLLGSLDLGSFLLGLSLGLSLTRRGRPRFTSNLRLFGRQVPIYSTREKEEHNGDS
ncbi:MAG TPA: hypothetical protein ENH11_01560 [Candidatus Acetothermia bacterium]|nr:hypothetical protein [Candidatus Acetothermia bacterium]